MIISLLWSMTHDPGFLEQELRDLRPRDDSILVEQLQILPEPGAIIVPNGLGIAEAFQHGTGLQDLLSDQVGAGLVDSGQVLHQQLGGLCLA